MSSLLHTLSKKNSCIVILILAAVLFAMECESAGNKIVWVEGEDMVSAPSGLEKIAAEKLPASGELSLYGSSLDKEGYEVVYDVSLPEDIEGAQVIVRYSRLHWRDTMVPAEIEVSVIGGEQEIVKVVSFDNTGGWGSKKAKEFDFVAAELGDLAKGDYVVKLKSLANNTSINVDGFFIAPATFKIDNAEMDPLNRVLITGEGYVGLSRGATVIRQDTEKTIDFGVRLFADGAEAKGVMACLTGEDDKFVDLEVAGSDTISEHGANLIQMKIPEGIVDGDYVLTFKSSSPAWELKVDVELSGEFLGSLDERLSKAEAAAEKLGDDSGYLTDFTYILGYLKTSQEMVAAATEPTVSAWKRGLAQHEGASNAASVVATMRRVMDQLEGMVDNVEAGDEPFDGMAGLMLRAYKSNATGEIWPYHVYVPGSYVKEDKVPFILFLHGGGGDENYWPELAGGAHMVTLEERGYLGVMPKWHSRNQPGEDVLQLYSLVMEQYVKIDQSRKYVTGVSMGGFGSYRFATGYPELFTGICCVSGTGAVEDAVKLKGIPVMILQGGSDTVVPPARAIAVNGELERLGYDVEFHIIDTYGHGYYPEYLELAMDFWEKYLGE